MIILCVKFQSEKVVILFSICSLIMWTGVCNRSCVFNNEIVFIAIWFYNVIKKWSKGKKKMLHFWGKKTEEKSQQCYHNKICR